MTNELCPHCKRKKADKVVLEARGHDLYEFMCPHKFHTEPSEQTIKPATLEERPMDAFSVGKLPWYAKTLLTLALVIIAICAWVICDGLLR